MSYDARHPQPLADPYAVHAQFGLAKVPPELLGMVGEHFSQGLYELRRMVAGCEASVAMPQTWLDTVQDELARLEYMGLQVQQLARVLGGHGRLTPEAFDLTQAVHQAIAQWTATASRRGATLKASAEPLMVDAAPGVVEQLLDFALDHAIRMGDTIDIDIGLQGLPPHPMVTLHVQGNAEASSQGAQDLHWQLFMLLARASGLSAHRVMVGQALTLLLGFPLAQPPLETGSDNGAELPHTPLVAGQGVLLVEPNELVRLQAHRLMEGAGLQVITVATIDQARQAWQDHLPDVLVIGLALEDETCMAFVNELRLVQPRLRVIELVDDDSAFSISPPGGQAAGRLGRHDLARTLVAAVSQELDGLGSHPGPN